MTYHSLNRSLDDLFSEINKFLNDNPREVVFLNIRDFKNDYDNNYDDDNDYVYKTENMNNKNNIHVNGCETLNKYAAEENGGSR